MTDPANPTALIQPEQLARPPDEMVCVVITLNLREADVLLEWVVQATFDVEFALGNASTEQSLTDNERSTLLVCLENLMLTGQACMSAAACAEIYKPHSGPQYHFIAIEPRVAVSIITMMARSQELDHINSLYRKISSQVDHAFLTRHEYVNVPNE